MFIDNKSFGKLPIAVQTLLAFTLTIIGVLTAVNAPAMSGDDVRWLYTFLLIAVLYLIAGIPSLLEGGMTMFYSKEEEKK